jgi:two-component system LytT family response regulator
MKVIIVDDEVSVRNTISRLLYDNFQEVNIVTTAGTIDEGYEAILEYTPDLIFLDIELPDGSGFDLLRRFSKIYFKIIFVTGHQEYALDAIKVSALDYILKPVDAEELKASVIKASEIIIREEEDIKLRALNENLKSKKALKRIILRTAEALQLVSVSDIIRAEADSNYTHFYLEQGGHIIVSRTIKEFESLLAGSGFSRVHQSHLVNLNYVDKFLKKDGGSIQLKDGSVVPVSPNLKKKVLKALANHLYE